MESVRPASLAPLLVGVLVVLSTALTTGAPQTRTIFEPERFTRTGGSPNYFQRTFTLPERVAGPYQLTVLNGQANGTGRVAIESAISAASVSLNGVEIIKPSDFSVKVARIDRIVELAETNVLDVTLASAPDSFITLTIVGSIPIGDLSRGRSGHTASVLGDGSVLIAAGDGGAESPSTAEKFDPSTLTFSPVADNLRAGRADHTASVLADGSHLLAGGRDAVGLVATTERFNATSQTFEPLLASFTAQRSGHTATVLLDGRVLIAGGRADAGLSSTERFDPQPTVLFKPPYDASAGTFQVLGHTLAQPRWDHTATLLPDGRVLIAGGQDDGGYLSSAEIFDPSTDEFVAVAGELPEARAGHTATLMPDGRVLIAGGRTAAGYVASMILFDPLQNSFSASPDALLLARARHTATLLPYGEVLISGGDVGGSALSHTEFYRAPGQDLTAPTLAEARPANGATGVDLTQLIGVRFSEPVDVTTLNAATVRLEGNGTIGANVAAAEDGLLLFVLPNSPLTPNTQYTLTLTSGITDTSGNPLATATITFTTVATPEIAAVTPPDGPPGTHVEILGQHFDAAAPGLNVVKFGTVEAVVSSVTPGVIETTVPANAITGSDQVTVTTRGGTAAGMFLVSNPLPMLSQITPDNVAAGSGDTVLSLFGSGFAAGAIVTVGTTSLAPTISSNAQLEVLVPEAVLATRAALPVTVTNPAPGGGTSPALVLAVRGVVIASVFPNQGSAGTSVLISGEGFDPIAANNQVSFNGVLATVTAATETSLETTVPTGATTGPITVTAPEGSVASPPFTVTSNSRLLISAVPEQAVHGRGTPIEIVTVLLDDEGNAISGVPIELASDPPASERLGNTFVYDSDGIKTITATAVGVVENGGPVTASLQLSIASPPAIACLSPFDGAILTRGPGTLIFSGAIGTADPITALSVNGTVVTVATDGTFTADINAAWGVNFVDLVATDGAGLESRRTCSFLVSDRWAPDTTPLHDTVALKTAQSAVDDFSRGGAVNSFGDVFGLILASSQLRDAIHAAAIAVNPLKPSSCDQRIAILGFSQCVLSSEVTYVASQLGGPNTVSLQLVNGGVMARARIEDPALRLRVRGHAAGIPYDTTGWIRFDFIETDITFDFSIDGAGRPRATIRANSVATRVGSITTEFSGIDGFIINLMTSLANGTVRDLVANTVRSFLTSQFQPVLDGIVGGIRIANAPPAFAVDRLDGSPLDVNLAFMFSSLNTTSNRLLIGMGSRMSSSPAHARPAPGAPVPPGAILLDPTAGSGIASASNIALLNQGLFALWRGGFFDATLEGGSLRGVVPQDTAIQLSMAMPAAASLLAGERVGIDLGAVDLRVHAPAIWPTPFDVEGGARVSCAIRLADGDLPAESCTVDELHLSTAPAFDEATAAAVRELTGAVLMAVAERVANDAFPSLPAPAYQLPTSLLAYGLPAGASLGMSTPSLTTEGNHAVLRGPFALVVPLTGNPVPAIHHLSPASTHIGNTDQRLAVFGSGFNASSRVSFDGTELTPLVSSSTRLDVVVPAALLAIPRAVPVVVTNPEPGGGASNAVTFTISGVFVAGASPNRGPAGTVVVITGAGFSPDPAANHVSFNGVPAEVVAAAPATLETIVPPAATTGPLVVTTAAGSAAVPFTVTSAAQLLVSAVPAQAVYARGSAITIVTHFVDTDGVPIAGVPIDLVSTPPADARDGNTFTYLNDGIYTITATAVGVLINGAPVTASVQIRVGEVSRRLMCQTPFDGGLVTAPPGSSITLTGSVDLSQGLTGFFVNGTPVSVNATGGFSVAIATQWGLNFADLRLIDGAGAEVREICSFLLSSTWAPDTHQQANTVSLRLAQSAVDDVGRAGAAESLGDILHTVLNSAALADTLHNSLMASNPLKPLACDSFVSTIFGTVCFYSSEVRYVSSALPGPNTASLTLVDGGMRAQVRVEDAQLQMRVRGKVAGVSYDTTGTVFFDFVEVTAVFDTSLSAGRPRVQVRPGSVTASVGSITTNFSGLDGFVLDTIGTLFQGTLRNQVRSLVQNYVTNNFAATLDGIAGALEITTVPSSYAVPRLDGGEPLSVLFGVGVSALSTTPSRMLTSLSTRLFTVPTHGRPTFGAPIQIPFLLDPPSGGFPVASSVDTAVLNQALHALWRGGYFDAVLTGGALDGLVPEGTLVQIATGLPPAARLRADGRLEVAVGNVAMRVQDATIAPDPVDVEIGGRVSCELSFDGHAVADACTVDELHLRPLGPADSAVTTALEQYVPGPLAAILRTAANHSLPALPVPAYRIPASLATYGFPAGAELGLTEPAFSTDGQRFVLRGGFAIR